jgi:hypothetical protein
MQPDETENVADEAQRAREHEQEAKKHDSHERDPTAPSGDPLDDDERKPAPPGPEAQQPRG